MTDDTNTDVWAKARREISRAAYIAELPSLSDVAEFLADEEHYAATGSLDCTCPNCPRSKR
ncbi:hypothetical protein [Paractinoplanes hotanensis]|uniref:Uncharacterized protein n=1 Tax=Paractinoplanes hotanensis TaxID=2906497 RepID=A0ABT0Y4H9_9ACTN|nr:hypothetical protein [Actinoplanes hotanensis]MCM4080418.1 hypothetical protein [Actinoplanes hotanensis]